MLIKSVVRKGPGKGTPISYTAEEAAPFAVERAIRALNTPERVYWAPKSGIKVAKVVSTTSDQGWSATATGTVNVGYTDTATDQFYVAKPRSFTLAYEESLDVNNMPDISIISFEMLPLSSAQIK